MTSPLVLQWAHDAGRIPGFRARAKCCATHLAASMVESLKAIGDRAPAGVTTRRSVGGSRIARQASASPGSVMDLTGSSRTGQVWPPGDPPGLVPSPIRDPDVLQAER